jgi:hypothetical protein
MNYEEMEEVMKKEEMEAVIRQGEAIMKKEGAIQARCVFVLGGPGSGKGTLC